MIVHNKNNSGMSILSAFSKSELEAVINDNPSLRGYLQGYLAEVSLKKQLEALPGVTSVIKIPDQDPEKGDLKVTYHGVPITIEVKSISTSSVREDILNDTWQGTVAIKNTDKREVHVEGIGTFASTALHRGEFDILAVSCYAVSGEWDFVFMENEYLPVKSSAMPNLLKTSFTINPETTPCLATSVTAVLDAVLEKKHCLTR